MSARETSGERLARLEEQMKVVISGILDLKSQGAAASESRKRVYETQERSEREIIALNGRITALERSVEAIRPTTAELEKVRDRVIFAGSLGRALWGIGKVLLSAATGAAAAWYAMTGKPPP